MKLFSILRWSGVVVSSILAVGAVLLFLLVSSSMDPKGRTPEEQAKLQKLQAENPAEAQKLLAQQKAEEAEEQAAFDLSVKRIIWYMLVGVCGFVGFFILASRPIIGGLLALIPFVGIAVWEFSNAAADPGGLAVPMGVVGIILAAFSGVTSFMGTKYGGGTWENALLQ